MKFLPAVLPLFLGIFALLGSGCVTLDDEERPSRRTSATLLTLVDESGQLTSEQLSERRRNIISYLVAEGYIYSGEDLVQSAAFADQIIRANLALDGSFELSIYRPERISHHEIDFDPAGYPVYTYFPGEIGYFGNGFDPYYLPIAPYYGPRHNRDRSRPPRSHDSGNPNRPPGQRPDWDRDHQGPPGGTTDRDRDRRRHSPTDRPPGGNHDGRPNRDGRPDNEHRPDPNQPGQNQPRPPRHGPQGNDPRPPQSPPTPPSTTPPVQTTRPNPSGPDRQPWNTHPARPTPPAAAPTQATPSAQPPGQPDYRRFRPELQNQQPSGNSSRTTPPPPATPGQSRNRPTGQPPGGAPPPRVTPPPRPAPAPAQENSNRSESSVQSETKNSSEPAPQRDPPSRERRR